MSGTPPTTTALAGSLDWTGRSGRAALGLSLLVLYLVVGFGPNFLGPEVLFPVVGLLFLVSLGQLRRRIRDVGWRGGWLWVTPVPVLGLFMQVILLVLRSAEAVRTSEPPLLRRLGFALALLLALASVARGVLFAPYWIPAGSMKPALMPGDYIFVGTRFVTPSRGDVVVFRHPVNGTDFVKRVIALEGDTVELRDGRVILNGAALPQEPGPDFVERFGRQGGALPRCANAPFRAGGDCVKHSATEVLADGRRYPVLDIVDGRLDNVGPFDVPAGHMFVLGDNRDNSLDSRVPQAAGGPGMVPLENVTGRVTWIAFSFAGDVSRIFRAVP